MKKDYFVILTEPKRVAGINFIEKRLVVRGKNALEVEDFLLKKYPDFRLWEIRKI